MGILLATTTIQLLSPEESDTVAEDWGGSPDPVTGYRAVGDPVRAHLSSPSVGSFVSQEGSGTSTSFSLLCDPCDLSDNMRVQDLSNDTVYDVAWSLKRGFPMPHVVASVTRSTSTS